MSSSSSNSSQPPASDGTAGVKDSSKRPLEENPTRQKRGKRAKKQRFQGEAKVFNEFHALQRNPDGQAFLEWYAKNKELAKQDTQVLVGSLRLLSEAGNVSEAEELYNHALENSHMLSEPLFSTCAKMFANHGLATQATQVISQMREKKFEPRLRTFRSVLGVLATTVTAVDQLESMRTLYEDMKTTLASAIDQKFPDDESYTHMLTAYYAVAKQMKQANDCENFQAALKGFDIVLEESFLDILLPSPEMLDVIKKRFSLEPEKWTLSTEAKVDADTCACSCCGAKLQPIEMGQEAKDVLLSQVDRFPADAFKREQGEAIQKSWHNLKRRLAKMNSSNNPEDRVDVIVDGANVAYYNVGASGRFSFANIDRMLQHLDSLGLKWLIFIHKSHLGSRDIRTSYDKKFVDYLTESGRLWVVPHQANDDWFWLYASLAFHDKVLLLSNDNMRDHLFLMLQERFFQRWKDRHQVKFHFEKSAKGAMPGEIILDMPPKYSKRSQGSGCSYHFPLEAVPDLKEEDEKIREDMRLHREAMLKDIAIRREADRSADLTWLCVSSKSTNTD